jgi:sporulation protein YunB
MEVKVMRRWGRARYWTLSGKTLVMVFFLLLLFVFMILERNVKPALVAIAEARAKILAIEAITEAVESEIVQTVKYQDLMFIHKDTQSRPVLIQPNTIEISRLAARTTEHVKNRLHTLEDQEILIPLGQATGSNLLANVGPRIKVTVMPVGTVSVNLVNVMEEAGINQTLHKIMLEVNTKIRIVVPLVVTEASVQHQVLLSQAVIVGDVPDTLFQLHMPR